MRTQKEGGGTPPPAREIGHANERRVLQNIATIGATIGAALVLTLPVVAERAGQAQPPAAAAGTPTQTPTKKDPLRFTAFNVSMPTGMAGVTEITIERWTTDEERNGAPRSWSTRRKRASVASTSCSARLQKIKPRTGFIRTPNSLGWDLKYAVENTLHGRHAPDRHRHRQARELRRGRERLDGSWTIPSPSSRCG